ncbi:MAG: ABC transporter substrate-binding protein [Burkholderiales bacterium]|nr:ABC transporter substrate-binding protein [Burkholderiales bacterium]
MKTSSTNSPVVRAFKHGDEQDRWLTQLRQNNRVEETPDVDSIFKKLKENRVDAMFSQPAVYRKKLRDLALENSVVIQDWTPNERPVPHGLILAKSRFSEKEAHQWRQLIEAMRTDGTLKRIYERYLPPSEAAKLLEK